MNRIRTKLLAAGILLCITGTLEAQQHFRSAYWLDGYNYAYRLNPAFPGERGFFSPLIGNTSVDFESNLPLTAFLFKKDDGYKFFLDDAVGDEEFLQGLKRNNKVNSSVSLTILATGFWVGKSYNTIEINSRTDIGLSLPYDALRLFKAGYMAGPETYNLSNIGIKAGSYLELSYGFTRRMARWMSFGFRLKALGSVASAEMNVKSACFTSGGDHWDVSADGTFDISLPDGLSIPCLEDGETLDFRSIQASSKVGDYFKLPGYGGALDLGFSFDLGNYVTASVAVTDLGFIYRRNRLVAKAQAGVSRDSGESLDDPGFGDALGDAFMSFNFKRTDTEKGRLKMLSPTVNAGLQLRMPFYERLSIGLLGTVKLDGRNYSWYEGRASLNLAVLNWLCLTGNYAYSNFGHSAGAALNIHAQGFAVFLGSDSLLPFTKFRDKLPVRDITTGVNFGINFNFGKKHSRFGKNSIHPCDEFNYKSKISDDALVTVD